VEPAFEIIIAVSSFANQIFTDGGYPPVGKKHLGVALFLFYLLPIVYIPYPFLYPGQYRH
jgi:hypothetical protein